ncbi:DUF2207 domain-containing protein [Tenggerimyces flavus]|uniref:DUF2207 domain-containing protein n=1 Tax=Tenggerimyces flavus TaxID=1708749 RepID=A0ABV7YLY9_9ACTN|nr:DUF2207 domain-containing protein [Tenggerimyces flavus]MBM7786272.1 hypothetical protein [Tenggerimyces flavus]
MAAVLVVVAPASPALAADDGQLGPYRITYAVQANGSVHVTEEFRFDFGATPNHGPERLLDTREPYDGDRNREYAIVGVEASSSTGAPADVDVEELGDQTRIRIGDPDATVSGPQSYRLTYTIEGALNAQPNGTGELFWDAAGPHWQVPIDDLTVTVEAPGGITHQRCLFGPPGSKNPCDDDVLADGKAVFTQRSVEPGEVLTVVAAFDLAGVRIPAPTLEERNALKRTFAVSPANMAGGAGAFALIGGVPLLFAVRRRRDKRYVGVTPGLTPAPGQPAREEYVSLLAPDGTAVQFGPPKDVSPGEAGVLLNRRVDSTHTTATLLDLAARGYLRISEGADTVPGRQPTNWTLTVGRGPDASLRPHENELISNLFGTNTTVSLSFAGPNNEFARAHNAVSDRLGKLAVERNWYPRLGFTLSAGSCIGLAFGGFFGFFILLVIVTGLGSLGLGLLGLGIVLGVVAAVASLFVRSGRTAAGEAVAQQVRGFRRYLEVAEAERLRFEEGVDIFSRYLPWAVAFGLADKWANVCERLARAGRIPPSPSWYDGPRPWSYSDYSLNLAGVSAVAVAATTPVSTGSSGGSSSSSGSSGFSSSSSSGGGGGGGGGGSW